MKNKTKTVFAFLLTLIAVALRGFQLLNTIDPLTGNVIIEYIPIQIIFDAGMLLAAVGVLLLGIFSVPEKGGFAEDSKSLGAASALLAAALMYDGFSSLFSVFADPTQSLIMPLALFALSVVAALYFVSLSVSMFSDKTLFPSPWLPAFVILQSAVRLLSEYIASVNNADISEHRFSILIAAAITVFWVFFARFCNKNTRSGRMLSVFTLILVFSAGVVFIPRILAVAVPRLLPALYDTPSAVFSANPLYLTDIATLIFAVVFIIYINRDEKVPDTTDEQDFFEGIKAISTDSDSSKEQMMNTIFGSPEQPTEPIEEAVEMPETVEAQEPTEEEEPQEEAAPEEGPEKTKEVEEEQTVFIPEPEAEPAKITQPTLPETKRHREELLDENASTDDIINSLLDEIMGEYGDDSDE